MMCLPSSGDATTPSPLQCAKKQKQTTSQPIAEEDHVRSAVADKNAGQKQRKVREQSLTSFVICHRIRLPCKLHLADVVRRASTHELA